MPRIEVEWTPGPTELQLLSLVPSKQRKYLFPGTFTRPDVDCIQWNCIYSETFKILTASVPVRNV